jgi:stage V sporulation protein SpoVS
VGVAGTIRVKATTPVAKLAGAIAHTLRGGTPCTVSCIGAKTINQAVKGVIVARRYLEEDGLETFVGVRLNRDVGNDAVDLVINGGKPRLPTAPADAAPTFKVSSKTNPFKLAGAHATRVRETGGKEAMTFMGMGAEAVRSMVKATAASTGYLVDDGGFGLVMVPETVVVSLDTGSAEAEERTAIRINLLASKA